MCSIHDALGNDGCEQLPTRGGERVHDHLPITPRSHEPCASKGANVVGDEVRGALDDPGEIADAQLVGCRQGRRDREPGRVRQSACPIGGKRSDVWIEALLPEAFGNSEIKTQQLALVVHRLTLTHVVVLAHVFARGAWTVRRGHDPAWEFEAGIREHLPYATVFTHVEPAEDPRSDEDTLLDRKAS